MRKWMICPIAILFSLVVFQPGITLAQEKNAPKKEADYYELMRVFVDTFEQIERNYVDQVDRRKLMEAAIKGMIGTLDQYSSYITPEEIDRFTQQVEQEFGGVGIQVHVDPKTKRLTVMTPLPGTPAYKAGVLAGDVIMEIEGKSTEGFTITTAIKYLKGKPGAAVTIGVTHVGSNKIDQITIVRDIIHVSTVLGDQYKSDGSWNYMLDADKKVGYIRLTHFGRHSAVELQEALEQLQADDMKALVLDLRFNPGGLLSQATAISDMFIESGRIVSTKGRNTRERVWEARKAGTYSGFPMAILVNKYSASASEIVSACLQDHKRATIIGSRTWGKGSVQNVIELENGQSALKLTTASYHRPSGRNIHRGPNAKESDVWGVTPDKEFQIRMTNPEMQTYLEYRRDRDVLSKKGPPKSDFKDKQLDKAISVVLAKLGGSKTTTEKNKKPGKKAVEAVKPNPAGAARIEQPRRIQIFLAPAA